MMVLASRAQQMQGEMTGPPRDAAASTWEVGPTASPSPCSWVAAWIRACCCPQSPTRATSRSTACCCPPRVTLQILHLLPMLGERAAGWAYASRSIRGEMMEQSQGVIAGREHLDAETRSSPSCFASP